MDGHSANIFRVVTAGVRPAHQGGIACAGLERPTAGSVNLLYCELARQQSGWLCRNERRKKRGWKEDETTASLLTILARGQT